MGERLLAQKGPDPALERMQDQLERSVAILARIVEAPDASAYWGAYAELHELNARIPTACAPTGAHGRHLSAPFPSSRRPWCTGFPKPCPRSCTSLPISMCSHRSRQPLGAWLLPDDVPGYDGSLDFAVWMIPLAAGVLAGVESGVVRAGSTRGGACAASTRMRNGTWARSLGHAWVRGTAWGAGARCSNALRGDGGGAAQRGRRPSYPIVYLTGGNATVSTTWAPSLWSAAPSCSASRRLRRRRGGASHAHPLAHPRSGAHWR